MRTPGLDPLTRTRVFAVHDRGSYGYIEYRILPCPWPLDDRHFAVSPWSGMQRDAKVRLFPLKLTSQHTSFWTTRGERKVRWPIYVDEGRGRKPSPRVVHPRCGTSAFFDAQRGLHPS